MPCPRYAHAMPTPRPPDRDRRCEQSGTPFSEAALTPSLLAECMDCLEFGKFKGGKFDIHIRGMGLDLYVSEVANTTLKEPKVATSRAPIEAQTMSPNHLRLHCGLISCMSAALSSEQVGKNIPTVAKMTQGEVVTFAAAAAEQMRSDGFNVLMEGRAQTLDYVRTPHRCELPLARALTADGASAAAERGERGRPADPPPTFTLHQVRADALRLCDHRNAPRCAAYAGRGPQEARQPRCRRRHAGARRVDARGGAR